MHVNSSNKKFVIAIDGTSASGKGTLAKKLAQYYQFDHLDSGKLYRLTANIIFHDRPMLRQEILTQLTSHGNFFNPETLKQMPTPAEIVNAATIIAATIANNPNLTSQINPELSQPEVSMLASIIAKNKDLRQVLKTVQIQLAQNPISGRGIVIDGRDIGTVICPNADMKFFVNADVTIRAYRRFLELQLLNLSAKQEVILEELTRRDGLDSGRSIAPLKPADDAILLDSGQLNPEQLLAAALTAIRQKNLDVKFQSGR